MQAVILAAGNSSRFEPFTSLGHKSLISLFGKPLLQHTLEALKKSDITNAIIVIAQDSAIPQIIQPISGLEIKFVIQNETKGMGHALLEAKEYLEETFFLVSGYHVDAADFISDMKKMQKTKDDIVLLAKEDTVLEKYGVLDVDGFKVSSLEEKPEKNTTKGLRVVSIYLLCKEFLKVLESFPVEEYHFEKALDMYAKKRKVTFLKTNKPTVTLKHTWDLLSIKDYFLLKQKSFVSKKATIAKNVILQGIVVVSDNVTLLEGVCIKGPCYLGEGVVVGNNAILRNGVVAEKESVIGATMEVKNSILMRNVTTHTGFIGDSIIGSYSRLAAGFCSANVRFDRKEVVSIVKNMPTNTHRSHFGVIMGEHVDTGTNVSTMPGVCIGNNVTIGPSTTVMENVDSDTLVYTEFKTKIKKKK